MDLKCKCRTYHIDVDTTEQMKTIYDFLPININPFGDPYCVICGQVLEKVEETIKPDIEVLKPSEEELARYQSHIEATKIKIINAMGVPSHILTDGPDRTKQAEWESLLDAAIDEIEYAIQTEKTKSAEVRAHYMNNAIRYIKEAKGLIK